MNPASVEESPPGSPERAPELNPAGGEFSPAALLTPGARTDVLNRLRRAEGQLRGIQRMVERGEDCLKVAQQFAAVRSALDSTYVRMTVCLLEQEIGARLDNNEGLAEAVPSLMADLEQMLTRRR